MLERALGFRLRLLKRLDGASSLNFRAERESDGLVFAVKCSPPVRQVMFDRLVAHLDDVRGTKAVQRLFEETCPKTYKDYNLICLAWCPGERRFPDQLTDEQFLAFLDEYQVFSAAMQRSVDIAPVDPVIDWRTAVLKRCQGWAGKGLKRLLEEELTIDSLTYRRERLRVVHADFHHGNFLFANGVVQGFFDLEEFCEGYPADDIVRYLVCAAEHLRWYQLGRLKAICHKLEIAVRHLPYASDEWVTAINALLMRKIFRKTDDPAVSWGQSINLLFRARLYRRLRKKVATVRLRSSAIASDSATIEKPFERL